MHYLLFNIANVMRSHGFNDDHLRYKETVKLLLARYCDEKEGMEFPDEPLSLQVFPGAYPQFMRRVKACYKIAANRYSRATTLFHPVKESELSEAALRDIVKTIQGMEFSSASNETMQQIFMSFVPAVFKKSLSQYFTPIGLIQTMVQMVKIGLNDKVADPGMGTADFLSAAMEYRAKLGDRDIDQRVFGVDCDKNAFDLAIVNMILNKDGQSGLLREDSIENHQRFKEEMQIVLCNPPFGENSIEKRPEVLKEYDLGHRWEYTPILNSWIRTDDVLPYQQLGILFIERCYKMLSERGRLGIILPEGYLCTAMYGYVRTWMLEHLRILSLTELPRRIFLKSDVDLRSNILIAQKVSSSVLDEALRTDYPIHADMVRKVGFKMGKGYQPLYVRDPESGLEIRDQENNLIPETDFRRVCDGFDQFTAEARWDRPTIRVIGPSWAGARISDIRNHLNLDMKPRRLMPRALANVRAIQSGSHVRLRDIADLVTTTVDILRWAGPGKQWRLVEGQVIRAVEGIVIPGYPSHAWRIAERKSRLLYMLQGGDIVVGLVRPERRNIGLLLVDGPDIVGAPDGIAVVRVKSDYKKEYPQEWLFATLRSEACRLQFWTESGGTSYGKLTGDNILDVFLPTAPKPVRLSVARCVTQWADAVRATLDAWEAIGSPEDRFPVLNSPSFGLVELTPGSEIEAEDEQD